MLPIRRLPLLVWHFTVDALYTALVMLRSHNAYYVVSGAIAAGILLVPLVAVARPLLAARRIRRRRRARPTRTREPSPAVRRRRRRLEQAAPVRRLSAGRRGTPRAAAGLARRRRSCLPAPRRPPTSRRRPGPGAARGGESRGAFLRRQRRPPDAVPSGHLRRDGVRRGRTSARTRSRRTGQIPGFSSAAARYVLSQGRRAGLRAARRRPSLPLNFWVDAVLRSRRRRKSGRSSSTRGGRGSSDS